MGYHHTNCERTIAKGLELRPDVGSICGGDYSRVWALSPAGLPELNPTKIRTCPHSGAERDPRSEKPLMAAERYCSENRSLIVGQVLIPRVEERIGNPQDELAVPSNQEGCSSQGACNVLSSHDRHPSLRESHNS
jgi:hypothetical protein